MEQRKNFILDYYSAQYTMSELCRAYGISRPTGYYLLKKYNQGGFDHLADQRSTPLSSHPAATHPEVITQLIKLKKKHPNWGARKFRDLLLDIYIDEEVPSATTLHKYLVRSGLVTRKKRRPRLRPLHPVFNPSRCNEIWSADYKGKFKLGNGRYCHPLTICDSFSRWVFVAQGHYRETFRNCKPVFRRVFRESGLPKYLHTDNGSPFGSAQSASRYGRLSYWLIELGIQPVFSDPASPQQNGRHERMHKDLKAECTRPAGRVMQSQQRLLNAFVKEYNEVRPHEALGMKRPVQVHERSQRPYPELIRSWYYPEQYKVKRVCANGSVRWGSHEHVKVSQCLDNKWVGFEQVSERIWRVHYRQVAIGIFDAGKEIVRGKYHKLQNIDPEV